jgi:signal transduction histidine kinase
MTVTATAFPLLVIRLSDLGRIAWEHGRTHARQFEKECVQRVSQQADILVVLTGTRKNEHSPLPSDTRIILERLVLALSSDPDIATERGWVMVNDIGDPQALNAAIHRALQCGERERERYAFFSTIGHELRTPLTAIRGYIETLLEEDLPINVRRRFLEIAHTESLRVQRIVEGMFDISLLDLHADDRRDDACESHIALLAAVSSVKGTPQGRIASIATSLLPGVSVGISYDRLVQVSMNLLENALKYGTPPRKIHLRSCYENERNLLITVDDNGPGIAEADRERIFELGERASENAQGSGIGLAVVRLYIERAGGSVICASSKEFGGSSFQLRLPIIASELSRNKNQHFTQN